MAPYSEQVLHAGLLQVWSTEWEVVWFNDHPRTLSGSIDLRYSFIGTKLTRAQVVALAVGLPAAWQAAVAAAATPGSSSGAFHKPAGTWPATVEVLNGRAAIIVKDMCRLTDLAQAEATARGLYELSAHADSKQDEVRKLFSA